MCDLGLPCGNPACPNYAAMYLPPLSEMRPMTRDESAEMHAELRKLNRPVTALRESGAGRGEASGRWVHCTPALLAAGVDCALSARRAGPGGIGHEHFVAASSGESGAPDGYIVELRRDAEHVLTWNQPRDCDRVVFARLRRFAEEILRLTAPAGGSSPHRPPQSEPDA